jgi:hypothetical protein
MPLQDGNAHAPSLLKLQSLIKLEEKQPDSTPNFIVAKNNQVSDGSIAALLEKAWQSGA